MKKPEKYYSNGMGEFYPAKTMDAYLAHLQEALEVAFRTLKDQQAENEQDEYHDPAIVNALNVIKTVRGELDEKT